MNRFITSIWLILSSFGIMFAVFSWAQDSFLFLEDILSGTRKGFFAIISGFILYYYVAKRA